MVKMVQLPDQASACSRCSGAALPLSELSATLQRCGLSECGHGSVEDCHRYLVGVQQLAYWLMDQTAQTVQTAQTATRQASHGRLNLFKRSNLAEFAHVSGLPRAVGRNLWRGY